MFYEIVLPQLGLTMEDGIVTSWQKQIGDRVEKDEILFTVETDKVAMEVESSATGFLNLIVIDTGERVPVGTVIAYIGDKPGEIPSEHRIDAMAADVEKPAGISTFSDKTETTDKCSERDQTRSSVASEELPVSPRARRLSKELGIDLSLVKPLGHSRIVEEDVRRFYEKSSKNQSTHSNGNKNAEIVGRISANRKVAAERLSESFQRAPHFYVAVEANAAAIGTFREQLRYTELSDQKLTYTDLLLRALAMAFNEHPEVNSYWENGDIRSNRSVNVGFAVQTSTGLVVPVIRDADQMKFSDFVSVRHSLTQKALSGRLSIQDIEGGSATLSNLGSHNVDWFQAVLNPPQSVILATGRIAKRPTVVNDSIRICETLFLSLSVDHRVLDGVAAAEFLSTIVKLIEDPNRLVG